jgi:hypothetical protein
MTRLYRKGDIVTIVAVVEKDEVEDGTGVVHDDLGPTIKVKPEGHWTDLYIPKVSVSLVRPFFKPDEPVIYDNGVETAGPVGTVKATNGDDVWVQLVDNKMQTWPANHTRLYDEKAGAA